MNPASNAPHFAEHSFDRFELRVELQGPCETYSEKARSRITQSVFINGTPGVRIVVASIEPRTLGRR